MSNVPREWLNDERNDVEERIECLKEYMQLDDGDGYASTIEFLRRYINMIDEELAKPQT